MKTYFLLAMLCISFCCKAQTATNFSTKIEINGIKLGYSYTIEELKKILGTPTRCYTWGEAGEEDFGTNITFKNVDIRLDYRNIVEYIYADSSNFTIKPYSFIKYGEPLSRINEIPNITEKRNGKNAIWLYINYADCDPILVFYNKDTQKIVGVSAWIDLY